MGCVDVCCGLGDATEPRPVVIYDRLDRPGDEAIAACRGRVDACRAWAAEHHRRVLDVTLDVLPAAAADGEPLSWAPALLVARVQLARARTTAGVGGADILVAVTGRITHHRDHLLGWLNQGQVGLISLDGTVVIPGDIGRFVAPTMVQVAAWRPVSAVGTARPVRPNGHE